MNAILNKAKAIVALVGSLATALLAIYGPDSPTGHILVVVIAVATGFATYSVPNKQSDPYQHLS